MSSDSVSRAITYDDRNLYLYVKIHCLTFPFGYSHANTLTSCSIARSYVDSLLSSSFVIWIDEQKKKSKPEEEKRRNRTR